MYILQTKIKTLRGCGYLKQWLPKGKRSWIKGGLYKQNDQALVGTEPLLEEHEEFYKKTHYVFLILCCWKPILN